jgi:hypothetical protein
LESNILPSSSSIFRLLVISIGDQIHAYGVESVISM